MNKRITYLLATLLIAQTAMPLSAQTLSEQTVRPLLADSVKIKTTSGGIITTPTTTGPAISVNLDKLYATEIADARAKINFQLHGVELKKDYTNQAASLHIALETNMTLTSLDVNGEATHKPLHTPGVVTVYNSKKFTFEFTAKNINPESIRGNSYFTFKIPGWLLTEEVDLEATVHIEQDEVNKPTITVDHTTTSGSKMVNLNSSSAYSRILYTTDGSEVTLASTVYDGAPIEVTSATTLKAKAFVGTMPSEQLTLTYHDMPSEEEFNPGDTTTPEGDHSKPEDTNPGGGSSSSGGSSNVGGNSSSNGNSNATVEDSTSEVTSTPTTSQYVPNTISNTVTTLIAQKDRNLTPPTTPVKFGLTINNQKVELENTLLVSNGRTLAPLRTITEALNIPIQYDATSKTVIIKTEDKLIEFPLGYNVAIINGEVIQIDTNDSSVMSTIQNGRAYLPLRFIAKQLNLNIHFDGEQIHMNK